ncbi:TPA: 50S ribosomal protein L13 [Candidatus Dependentiae bacterium]|nr:50S ribosomal protein L13 [Candidatus Dependentiae bacterium]
MNRTFYLKTGERKPQWHVIDAAGKVAGRLATEIAALLRGKKDPSYTPHIDAGDYVIVINSNQVVLTGDKLTGKEYVWYTGWRSGQRRATPQNKMDRCHEFVIQHAVKGMLPNNKLADAQIKRLKIYPGAEHPHEGQVNV